MATKVSATALDDGGSVTPGTGTDLIGLYCFTAESSSGTRDLTTLTLGGVSYDAYDIDVQEVTTGVFIYNVYAYLTDANLPSGSSAQVTLWDGGMSGNQSTGVFYVIQDANQSTPITGDVSGTEVGQVPTGVSASTASSGVTIGMAGIDTTGPAWTDPDDAAWGTTDRNANDPTSNAYKIGYWSFDETTGQSRTFDPEHPSASKNWAFRMFSVQTATSISITSVSGDDVFEFEDTGIALVGDGLDTVTSIIIRTNTGSVSQAQSNYSSSDANNATFDGAQGNCPYTTASYALQVRLGDGATTVDHNVTVNPTTGEQVVETAGIINGEGYLKFYAAALDNSDQIWWNNAAFTIAADSAITYDGSNGPSDSTSYKIWDATDQTWGTEGTVTVNEAGINNPQTTNLGLLLKQNRIKNKSLYVGTLDYASTIGAAVNTSGDSYELFRIPRKCYLTKAELFVITPFDSATSATANIGVDGGDELIDGADLTSAANSLLSGGVNSVVPKFDTAELTVTFTPTYTGATTEGKVLLVIEYIEVEKASGNLFNVEV